MRSEHTYVCGGLSIFAAGLNTIELGVMMGISCSKVRCHYNAQLQLAALAMQCDAQGLLISWTVAQLGSGTLKGSEDVRCPKAGDAQWLHCGRGSPFPSFA